MRVIFLGQKPVGERCFALARAHPGVEVVAAVSNVGGTGAYDWWGTHAIHDACARDGLPFAANPRGDEAAIAALIAAYRAEAIVSVQHPWILSRALLDAVGGHAWNLHNAKLPDYRGFNTISHAILAGDPTYTSTIHWMGEVVDGGDLAFEDTIEIAPDDTARTLYDRACEAGVRAFERLLACLAAGTPVPRITPVGDGQFYDRRSLDPLREIRDPSDADEVDRKARAFWFPPFEPAYTIAHGRRCYVVPAAAWLR